MEINSQLKASMNDIKDMKDMYNTFKDLAETFIEQQGYKKSILDSVQLSILTVEKISTITYDEAAEIITPYLIDPDSLPKLLKEEKDFIITVFFGKPESEEDAENTKADLERYESVLGTIPDGTTANDITDEQAIRCIISYLKSSQLEINVLKFNCDEAEKEVEDIAKEYLIYNGSTKAREKRENMIAEMEKKFDSMPDSIEKSALGREIKTYKDIASLSFVTDRIKNNTQKEIKAIMAGVGDSAIGEITLKKYLQKIKKFNFTENTYKVFLNLEEKYLGEEFYPFNNLFLYNYMRFIGHLNPYDSKDMQYAKAFTSQIAALVYKQFVDKDAEDEMINVIKEFDSYFMDYIEEFKVKNETYPLHPTRIAHEKAIDSQRKEVLLRKLKELNVDESEYSVDMDSNELNKIYLEKMGVVEEEQKEDYEKIKKTNVETVEDEDGNEITNITPVTSENILEEPVDGETEVTGKILPEYDPLITGRPIFFNSTPDFIKNSSDDTDNDNILALANAAKIDDEDVITPLSDAIGNIEDKDIESILNKAFIDNQNLNNNLE